MPKIKMPARSFYDRTHEVKGPVNLGRMYPILHEEIMPGDTASLQTELMLRMQPMIRPISHEMTAYVRFFFVRDWTIMPDFEEMISMGPDGESDVTVPMNPANYTVEEGGTWDWLNVNPGVYDADMFNMLPLFAYNKVYNDWYRPQNQVPDEVELNDTALKYTTWERDLYTSALPFTQRGPQVIMPLGTSTAQVTLSNFPSANVKGFLGAAYTGSDVNSSSTVSTNAYLKRSASSEGSSQTSAAIYLEPGTTAQDHLRTLETEMFVKKGVFSGTGTVDLSQAGGVPINDWRNYLQVQAWMELNALGGIRYPGLVLQHFGVVAPDARVVRAEYLGSMKVPIVVSEVLQTSNTNETSPQGNMAGHGIGANRRNIFKRSFTEHGWLIGILTVVPKSGYSQGIPIEYMRQSALDFPWPLFTRLGMRDMPIKALFTGAYLDENGELTTPENGTWTPVANPDRTFGYYTIYDELRYKTNSVHGKFRSDMAFWHLNRLFNTEPQLSKEFVECRPQTDRILAVPSEEDATVQMIHRLKMYRELPRDITPWHF